MENKGIFTKILAITGTILAWLPILTPVLFSIIFFIRHGIFRFDYLMPAELFPALLVGGGFLLWASLRSHSHRLLITWSLGIALTLMLSLFAVPELTGLADGTTAPSGWPWMLVIGLLILYMAAVVTVGVGGVLLSRGLFKADPWTSGTS